MNIQTTNSNSHMIEFNDDQVMLLKNTICKGSTDDELQLFMHVCKKTGLDPFARQIYAVKRFDASTGKQIMALQTGIDGYRLIAERTGKYMPGRECTFTYNKEGRLHSATAYVKKLGGDQQWHEIGHTVFWDEYAAKKKDGGYTGMWKDKPHVMLGKCLPYRACIQTDLGIFRIGDIVNNKMNVKVRSINLKTGLEEWKPVTAWIRNEGTQHWQKITVPNKTHGNRPILTTPDHLIYTQTGWKAANEITVNDQIAVASCIPSKEQKQILIGSLLGDGTMLNQKNRHGCPSFSESHSMKQFNYLEWKHKNLSTFNPTLKINRINVKGIDHEVVRLQTKSSPYFYNLSNQFYKKRKKIITSNILNELDDLGVAIWIMDDGSIKKTGDCVGCRPYIRIFTCCFNEQNLFIDFFKNKYCIDIKILRSERNPYISIGADESEILLDRLKNYIIFDPVTKDKKWIANDVEQGFINSFCFVPCLKNEIYDRGEKEGKYDITVQDNHNFIYNNVLVHNCAESAVLRKAFPADMGGIYTSEEMENASIAPVMDKDTGEIVESAPSVINSQDAAYLKELLEGQDDDYKSNLLNFFSSKNGTKISSFDFLPQKYYHACVKSIRRRIESQMAPQIEVVEQSETVQEEMPF